MNNAKFARVAGQSVGNRFVSRRRRAAILTAGGVGLGVVAAGAARADYTWAGNTGNFSDPTQWVNGVAPTGTSVNDVLNFGGSSAYTATIDNSQTTLPGFYFGNITFNATATGNPTIAPSTSNLPFPTVLNLRAANPTGTSINQLGAGAANITAPINIANGTTLTVNVAAGAGPLSIVNTSNGTVSLQANVLFGTGNVNFVNNSTNAVVVGDFGALRGEVFVSAGTVVEADGIGYVVNGVTGAGGGDVIGSNNLLHVAAGATFDFNANGESMGGVTGDGNIRLGGSGGLTFMYTKDLTFNGTISGPASGTGTTSGLSKDDSSGNTTFNFTGGNMVFGGNTTVSSGTMRLAGGANIQVSKALVINNGSTFLLDNSTQNVVNRFTPTATVTLGGVLSLVGGTDAVSTQKVGAITFNLTGAGNINVTNGGGTGTAALTATSIARSGTRGSYADFTGNGAVNFTTAPTRVGGILTYATVNGSDWATIDTNRANLVVPFTGYQTGTDPTTFAATDNVQVDGPVTVAASATVNSLKFTNAGSSIAIADGQTLTLTGGGVLALNGGLIDGANATVVANQSATSADVLFVVQGATNTLTVNAAIGNAPVTGLTKVGPGTLVLNNANNSYGGTTRVFGGTLALNSDSNLGTVPSGTNANVVLSNGTLRFLQPGFVSARTVQLNGPNNVVDTNGNDVTFNAFFNGNGDVTKVGVGTLILGGTNGRFISGGNLHIASGTVRTGQGDTFGTSTIITVDSGAVLDLSFDKDGEGLGSIQGGGEVRMLASSGVTYGNGDRSEINFSGIFTTYLQGTATAGAAGLTKNAQGNLTLSGASTYTGVTKITNGSITIAADALPGAPGPLGNSGSALALGSASLDNNNTAFYVGVAGVTMGRDITDLLSGASGPTGVVTLGATHTSGTSAFTGSITTNHAIELAVPAGARTDFTGNVGGNGSFVMVGQGTVGLLGNVGLFGGVSVNSGTIVVNGDTGLGDPSAAFNLNGGTLQTLAGFTTPRTINIDAAGGTLVNADTVNPLVLTGTVNAMGTLTKGSNASTLQFAQSGTVALAGLTVLGGTVSVATGGPLSINGALNGTGSLNVSDNVRVQLGTNNVTAVPSTIGLLNLNTSGGIDVGANLLATQTPLNTVRTYLAAGAAGGFAGTGTNAAIYSSTVALDAAHKSIAYVSGANPANAALNSALTNTAAVLIRPSLIGDFNIDGKVDRFDIRAFNARNAFNDGLTTHDWSDGDLNFDGKVDRFDIRAFNAGNNFNSGAVFAQAQTLTSATPTAISNTTTVGTVGDGKPDLVYNSTTGDVVFKYDGYAPAAGFTILELDIASSKNSLNANGVNAGAAGSISKGSNDIDYQNLGSTPIADGADLGTIFPLGLTAAQLTTNDITANFFLNGDGSPTKFADVVGGAGGVPEPATLSLVGIAAAGLLSRKRRK